MTAQEPLAFDNLTPDIEIGDLALGSPDDATLNRQAVIVALGRRAIAPPDISVLLQDAALMAAKALGTSHFGVAQLTPNCDVLTLRLGQTDSAKAGNSLDEYELDSDSGVSMSGYALHAAKPAVVDNLESETRFSDAWIQGAGIQSGIVYPLRHVGQSFGTLGVYHDAPREFTPSDILFVESIAHLMTTTLARQRAEQELAEKEQFSQTILEGCNAPVVTLRMDGCIENANPAFFELAGFPSEEISGRKLSEACLSPEDASIFEQALARVDGGTPSVRLETFMLTSTGQQRRVAWSLSAVQQTGGGQTVSFVATGLDISQYHDTLRQLEATKERAVQAERSIAELKNEIERRELIFDQNGKIVPPEISKERRSRQRHPYPYVQYVAPITGDDLPAPESFRRVLCRDISANGFSMLCKERPNCQRAVISFGGNTRAIYMIAEIVHVTPFTHDDQRVFLVGCRYIGRAHYSDNGSDGAVSAVTNAYR